MEFNMQKRFILALGTLTILLVSCPPSNNSGPTLRSPSPILVALRPVGNVDGSRRSTVSGIAEIYYKNDNTAHILVKLGNLPAEKTFAGRINFGRCDDVSPNALTKLDQITSDRYNSGVEITRMPEKILQDTEGTSRSVLAIQYYQRPESDKDSIGDPITCGNFTYTTRPTPIPNIKFQEIGR
jgi:hypothetical protein